MTAPALAVQVQGEGPVSADNLNTYQQTCDTFDDLRAFIGTAGVQVYARGRDAVADGYGGVFYWSSASTATDNDLTVIAPTGEDTGRWIRVSPYTPGVVGWLTGSATVNFPSCADGDMEAGDVNITVTGAAVGDFVQLSSSTVITAKCFLWGVVSAPNTVIPYIGNMSGSPVNENSMSVYALVMKRG